MKLSGRDTQRFCKQPDTSLKGALIHGPDAGMIAVRRRELVSALLGADKDDLRITNLTAADVRKDTSLLDTELKARGFFPGRRIVVIESTTDGLSKLIGSVLGTTTTDDAFLILTAGMLPARSSLRQLFERANNLAALQQFQDSPGPNDIEDMLKSAGMTHGVTPDGLDALTHYAATADYGSFLQAIEMISIFDMSRDAPLSSKEIDLILPAGQETEIDAFIDAVTHGNPADIGPQMRRLQTSGVNAVTLLIALQRQFRQLLLAATAPGGPEAGLARIRPPLWGARKSAMQALLRRWQPRRLEQATQILFETDSKVRSSSNVPDMALIERCSLRLAMMARRAS